MKYRRRVADELLQRKLKIMGAVLIEGPKWCGKTTTGLHASKSVLRLDDPAQKEQILTLSEIDPVMLLKGDTPRLLDEWQLTPKLWDAVRHEFDDRQQKGQFILTGSSVPVDFSTISHSGIGRISHLTMRPMSLFESEESTGEVSISSLFENQLDIRGVNKLDLATIASLLCRGGWPQAVDLDDASSLLIASDYCYALQKSDLSRADGVKRDRQRVESVLRAYARLQGTQATKGKILQDIRDNDFQNISVDTIHSYLEALRKVFVIEDMPAWNPKLRSKAAIRSSDTRYFVDPSIAVAALGTGPQDLFNDLNTFGFLFEAMCIRDLRVYAQALDADVYHFRDSNYLECDAVIHTKKGQYGLIEVKLGGDKLVEEGAQNLKKLKDTIDTTRMPDPAFLMVLTATGSFAYRRKDGVLVVPIGCLRD